MLESEGLVESIPRRGATVRSYAVGDLDDVYQLRALLEGYAARRAATRISADDVARLEESCDRFDRLRAEDDLLDLVRRICSSTASSTRRPRATGSRRSSAR